jgi:hypothetical protein
VLATLRGIHHARSNRQENIRVMKWTDMDQGLAEGSYEMTASSWSVTGSASGEGLQVAMEEIRAEFRLDTAPDPASAFDFSFVR